MTKNGFSKAGICSYKEEIEEVDEFVGVEEISYEIDPQRIPILETSNFKSDYLPDEFEGFKN